MFFKEFTQSVFTVCNYDFITWRKFGRSKLHKFIAWKYCIFRIQILEKNNLDQNCMIKICFLDQNFHFRQKFDFWPKFRFSKKIDFRPKCVILVKKIDFRPIFIFRKKIDFRKKFRLSKKSTKNWVSTKISILKKIFDSRP